MCPQSSFNLSTCTSTYVIIFSICKTICTLIYLQINFGMIKIGKKIINYYNGQVSNQGDGFSFLFVGSIWTGFVAPLAPYKNIEHITPTPPIINSL